MTTPTVAIDIATLRRRIEAGERHAKAEAWARDVAITTTESKGREFVVVNRSDWERIVAGKAPKSKGLGDTIAKVAKWTGAEKVAKAYEKATGKDCGCDKRRAKLN